MNNNNLNNNNNMNMNMNNNMNNNLSSSNNILNLMMMNNNMNNNNNINNNNNMNMNMNNNMNIFNNMNMINNMNMNNNMNHNNNNNMNMFLQKNTHEKQLNQIVGIESIVPIQTTNISTDNYNIITQICFDAVKENVKDMSLHCCDQIKKKLNKQSFVLIQNINDDNFDFKFTKFDYKDILIFRHIDKIFYVKLFNK